MLVHGTNMLGIKTMTKGFQRRPEIAHTRRAENTREYYDSDGLVTGWTRMNSLAVDRNPNIKHISARMKTVSQLEKQVLGVNKMHRRHGSLTNLYEKRNF